MTLKQDFSTLLNLKVHLSFCILCALFMLFIKPVIAFEDSNYRAKDTFYILDSKVTRAYYKKLKQDKRDHTRHLTRFSKFLDREPYQQFRIDAEQIFKLPSNSVLLVLDSIALTDQQVRDIENFVDQGGSLLFNHKAGFYDENGGYRGDELINNLTGLSYLPEVSKSIEYEGHFMTARMLSPVTEHFSEAERLTLIAYEEIPLFRNQTLNEPDMILTNWSRTETPKNKNEIQIPLMDAGVLWHGQKNKGRWVYLSLPSNIFDSRETQAKAFEKLLQGMLDYLNLPAQAKLMPYLDLPSATVIFEDVEHQYETLNDFMDLGIKYNMPLTTYQVANKAQGKPEILRRAQISPMIEVGSHSYTHGPIVGRELAVLEHEIADSKAFLDSPISPVTGYRPPREEIDEEMLQVIKDAGYGYTFVGIKDKLYPQMAENEFIQIPRLGSDDYEFFIIEKMSPGKILHTAINEEKIARGLNAVYTLGVHTQMMTQPDRIYILDAILERLATNQITKVITAVDMVQRVRQAHQISSKLVTANNSHQLSVSNYNRSSVRHLVYRFYWQGGQVPSSISVNDRQVTVDAIHYKTQKFSDVHLWNLGARQKVMVTIK
jgi:hypothetical protein